MAKEKFKQAMDYLPFILLVIYTVYEWLNVYVTNTVVPVRTYVGVCLLLLNAIIFIRYHQAAVLFTGLMCILGIFTLIMLSPSVITNTVSFLPLNIGDLYFFGIFIIHFIISFRFYTGILTKQYWNTLVVQMKKHER